MANNLETAAFQAKIREIFGQDSGELVPIEGGYGEIVPPLPRGTKLVDCTHSSIPIPDYSGEQQPMMFTPRRCSMNLSRSSVVYAVRKKNFDVSGSGILVDVQ